MTGPYFIVDRIEGGYAVVWSALTEEVLDIPLRAMPSGLSEGEGLALEHPDATEEGPIRVVAISDGEAVLAVESVLRLGCSANGLPAGVEPGARLVFRRRPADAETAAVAARIRRLAAEDDGGDWSI